MEEEENRRNMEFWKRRGAIAVGTGGIVLLVSLLFYAIATPPLYGEELTLEALIIAPVLAISSMMVYLLDRKFRKTKAGYLRYLGRSLGYLYIVAPFWVLSVVYALSFRDHYLSLLYYEAILAAILVIMTMNIRVHVWQRRSKEIDNGEVASGAWEIAMKMGIQISGIRIVDWSKEKIANAFQAGLLHYYIFVSNFLLDNLSVEQDVAILAHEMAHAKRKHLKKTMIFIATDMIILGNIVFITLIFNLNYSIKASLFLGVFLPIFVVLYIFLPFLQRRYEKEADIFAANFVNPKFLAESLLKISELNHTPKNIPRRWNLSHPSTSERVAYLAKLGDELREE